MTDHDLDLAEKLRTTGVLEPIDIQFAQFLCRLAGDSASSELFWAAALASNVTQNEKHVCLKLPMYAGTVLETDDGNGGIVRLPPLAAWLKKLKATPIVGTPGAYTPLVLDDRNRLYLYRYWLYEQRLATAITQRHALPPRGADPGAVQDVLKSFGAGHLQLDELQMVAAIAALTRYFCVITGGPGTGKTFTVAVILKLFSRLYPDHLIRICAPTGKAANRLCESLQQGVGNGNFAQGYEVATIHRLLGISQTGDRITYTADNPLPADVVIVDEASMVPLALMAKLTAALRPHCAIILLGDKDQLASVEAGSVLGDICEAFRINAFSPQFCTTFAALTGKQIPAQYRDGNTEGSDSIIELTRSYRFDPAAGIGALSAGVKHGNAGTCRSLLARGDDPQISWRDLPEGSSFEQRLAEVIRAWLAPMFSEPTAAAAYAWCTRFKILCAHRHGRYGVTGITAAVERILREQGRIDTLRQMYRGKPVMVVRNDYHLRLFNGDTGIVWDTPQGDVAVFFPEPDGSFRQIALARLPEYEPAFAITIHKAQGSEFDRVLLILPDRISPLLTRELVYTGITRARTHVELWSPPAVFEAAVHKRFERASGLKDVLIGRLTAPDVRREA